METKPFLKRVYLEITNVCNQNCPFCPKTTRQEQFLTLENFKLVLEKLQGHTNHLYFHVLGEPLCHPHLPRFLQEAHKQGYHVNLVTNGALIEEVGPQLLEQPALRQISFSLHSLAYQGEAITNKRLGEIINFVDQTQGSKLYLSLRLWTGGTTENHLVLTALSKHFSINNLTEKLANSQGRGIRLSERIFLNPAEEFIWPNLDAPFQPEPAFCHALTQQMAILVDGTVVPCCLDGEGSIVLGNIYHSSLAEIYNSIKAQKILMGFEQGQAVEELCKRCQYRTRFSRTK